MKLKRSTSSLFILFFFALFACQNHAEKENTEDRIYQIDLQESEGQSFYNWSADRIPLVSAHRGGPYPGYPENAIETFEYVLSKTHAIIECDIGMTSDSVLVLLHDNTLDRTTTGTGKLVESSWEDVKSLSLVDNAGQTTNFSMPTLEQALIALKGRALFTLDVKRGVPFEKVVEIVKNTNSVGNAAIITYRAEDAKTVFDLDNRLMISVGLGNASAYEAHHRLGIPDQNMIAFVGVGARDKSHFDWLHEKGIFTILGTMGNLDQQAVTKGDQMYQQWVNLGADILATDRPLEAAEVILPVDIEKSSKFKFFK